jgi:hypothetical protein
MNDSIYRLVNPEFNLEFAGKEYRVRKANLDKALQYQTKVKELSEEKSEAMTLKIAAFCLYLVLKDSDPTITEEFVWNNTPGDIDPLECMVTLGFMSPKKAETAQIIKGLIEKKQTSDSSSS